jgi:5'-3' exonuclease
MGRSRKDFSWVAKAACTNAETRLFLSYDPEEIAQAKAICDGCSVKKPCYSASFDIDCIAGGTTFLERLKLKRKRIETIDDIKRN